MARITLGGNPVNTVGELPAEGAQAPAFTLTNGKLEDVGLGDFAGKRKLLNIFPSVDTPVCAKSMRTFNETASAVPGAVMLMISADLPFAQGRACSAEGLKEVVSLSMMRDKRFAEDYGVLISDGPMAGLSARAVVVLDADDRVVYTQLVSEIGDEPDYDAALAALKA